MICLILMRGQRPWVVGAALLWWYMGSTRRTSFLMNWSIVTWMLSSHMYDVLSRKTTTFMHQTKFPLCCIVVAGSSQHQKHITRFHSTPPHSDTIHERRYVIGDNESTITNCCSTISTLTPDDTTFFSPTISEV